MAGLEPATPRLEVWCAIHCATRAQEKKKKKEKKKKRKKI